MRILLLLSIPFAVGAAILLLSIFDDATGFLWLVIVATAIAIGTRPGRNNDSSRNPHA